MGIRKKVSDRMINEFIRLYLDRKWSISEIANYFGLHHETVRYHLKKRNIALRRYNESRVIRNGLKLNLEPSESLSYILGVIEGDGCVTKNKNSGHYYTNLNAIDKDFVDEFERHLRNIGFTKIQRSTVKYENEGRKNQYVVRAYSKYFYDWYWNLDKYKSYIKMFKSNHDYMAMFLKGMFDSEGCVEIIYSKRRNPKSAFIHISNTNEKLIDLCCKFLESLDIQYRLELKKRKNDNKKDVWKIFIKPHSFNDFREKIGTSIKRKYDKMYIACSMKRVNYLTDKERTEIIKLYNEGYNINQIRKKIGRDFNTVKRCLQKESII